MKTKKQSKKNLTVNINEDKAHKKVHQIKSTEELNLKRLKRGQLHRFNLHMQKNPLGNPWKIPILIAHGKEDGPVLGITAAVHGNELNGMPTIFKIIDSINLDELKGTVIAVPVSNVPGFLLKQRTFSDGVDLNRIMPGKEEGLGSEMYAYQFTHKLIKKFDFLLDLHTASFGRINSLYVRADLDNKECARLAMLQNPQIIVNKYDEQGTLRAWANSIGVHSITVEIGNPHSFQHNLIDETFIGIQNVMKDKGMIPGRIKRIRKDTWFCERSFWIYSYRSGVIDVTPGLTDIVEKGDIIARVYDVFGNLECEITAPARGVVIGKNVNPVCESGTRVLHLGITKEDLGEELALDE